MSNKYEYEKKIVLAFVFQDTVYKKPSTEEYIQYEAKLPKHPKDKTEIIQINFEDTKLFDLTENPSGKEKYGQISTPNSKLTNELEKKIVSACKGIKPSSQVKLQFSISGHARNEIMPYLMSTPKANSLRVDPEALVPVIKEIGISFKQKFPNSRVELKLTQCHGAYDENITKPENERKKSEVKFKLDDNGKLKRNDKGEVEFFQEKNKKHFDISKAKEHKSTLTTLISIINEEKQVIDKGKGSLYNSKRAGIDDESKTISNLKISSEFQQGIAIYERKIPEKSHKNENQKSDPAKLLKRAVMNNNAFNSSSNATQTTVTPVQTRATTANNLTGRNNGVHLPPIGR